MLTIFSGDSVTSLFDNLLDLHEYRLGNNRGMVVFYILNIAKIKPG